MSALPALIGNIIEKQGPISVAAFMDLALQHPEFGYYRQHDPLGKTGDFITAPEVSQMFGEMIGLWCAEAWRQMEKPETFTLLELGPGRGTLMQDALRATAKIVGFHAAMHLCLCESNPTLRKAQQEKLAVYDPVYIANPTSNLHPRPTIIIANEFFDALPIRQFEKTFQGWSERLVAVDKGKLSFILSPTDPAIVQLVPQTLREANPGTVYELPLASLSLVRSVSQHIARHGGVALIIDYGFVEPTGRPTLQAVSQHQFTPVLAKPGEVDLTAHVDFGALKNIAASQQTIVSGPIGQGEFLQVLGIELRAVQLKQRSTPKQAKDIDDALRRLTDASQMGALFKAMAIASKNLGTLAGF